MRSLVSSEEMRAAEQEAATRGLTSEALMQLAGRGAARALLDRPGGRSARYLVLAGPGNNGGDALVVAGLLQAAGAMVQIITYKRTQPSRVDPPGVPRFESTEDPAGARLIEALQWCDVVIDGLLGTGTARPPAPDLAAILRAVNEAAGRRQVVALDLPTGVQPDNGRVYDDALHAQRTLTFGYVKRGLLLYPARAHCGVIQVIDIGLPEPPAAPAAASEPDVADIRAWLPERSVTAHKYSAGAVLALAGTPHFVGAPLLCTTAALRAGAGYVTLAVTPETMRALGARILETTMLPLPSHADGSVDAGAFDQIKAAASRYPALLVGPGLGREESTQQLILRVLTEDLQGPRAAVIDADALVALSLSAAGPAGVRLPAVLTPHTGEMARLTGLSAAEIEADRFDVATRFARQWGKVVVLKGAPTVIAAPTGELAVNPTGNQLLATAGTGDVLSGVVAAFLAGGAAPYDAARAAVYIHGLAADLAIPDFGDRGLIAGDLLALLPRAIKQVREGASVDRTCLR
jgi:NAD(P)H-hydrate epimerase